MTRPIGTGFEFRLLGPLCVTYRGRPVPVAGPKPRALLAALLVDANRVVPVGTLVERLWGEHTPSGARVTLQNHVMRLRRALASVAAADPVLTAPDGYLLAADDDRIDLRRFGTLLDRATALLDENDPARARPLLAEALALWRGDALADIRSDALHRDVVPALTERRMRALELRVQADLHLGGHARLSTELAELTALHPLRERLWTARLLALHRAGLHAEALAAYRIARRTLGIEPSFHAPVTTTSTRNELPPCPADFTGRTTELDALLALPERGGVVTIDGMPGVGKTALAVAAAHRLAERYPDAQLYLDLHGHSPREQPVRPFAALGTMLSALGLSTLPSTVDERSALLRASLSGRRVLVLLDNAASAAQLRPLLPDAPGVLVIVTSRRRLTEVDAALTLSLDVLPPPDALGLFQRIADPAVAEIGHEVVRRCGYLPLAIRIAAAHLRTRSAQHLLRSLRSRNRLTELATGECGLLAAFDTSYQRLGPAQQDLFRRLGRLPTDGFDVPTAASAAGLAPCGVERLLADLRDAGLLGAAGPGRYRAHELIREYAGILEYTVGSDLPAARPA